MANRDIVTPNYVLNGVSSRRWIKPVLSNDLSITGSGDFSCSADYCLSGSCATNYCSVTGCPSVTRAFYNLSEDGEVYLTTSNGVIYYLANDSKEMRQIYPLRKIETTPDSVVVGGEDVTVDPNSNVTFVIPSRTHIIPWRPGTTNCNISVGEHYMDRSFVLMTRDQMTFPTSNGYFCVQVDYNRCVVFYKGELIYDGEYNGMGLPLSFSYGLERCVYGGSLGCCPKPTSSINWEYRVMPKWREEDGKFVFESAVDRFLKGVKIYERSKVIGSNLFEWDAKSSKFISFGKYFADDSYQKIVKEVDESYEKIVRDESGMPVYENGKIKKETKTRKVLKEVDFADEFPGYRRFDVYRIDADYVNGLDPYALCWFAVPLSEVESGGTTFLRGTIGDSATQSYAREIDKLLEIIDQIKGMDAESFFDLVSFKGDFSYLSLISKIKHFADTLKLGLTHIAELLSQVERLIKGAGDLKETYEWIKGYIAAKNSEINEDINDYKTFVSKLFARDREGGVRIWWSPTIGTGKENEADEQEAKVFCGLRDEEKQAVPVFGCESELLYRCWEQLKLRHCTENEFGLSPKFLKWYSGTGYSEAEGNDILALPDNLDEVMNEFHKMNDNPTTQEEKSEETEEGSESGNQDSHKSSGHQTMWLSRWRNELCVYCNEENSTNEDGSPPCRCIDTSLASNPYTTNNNCKWTNQSNNPGVCGKCNYPVTFEEGDEEPCWTHVPDIPELDEDGNPVLDEEGNPKYRNCISYRLDNDGNYNVESGHFTHYCSVAVAKVALDYLGGRVESVLYEDGSLSDWGFIRIGASDCRVKKDYTVVGQIDGPFDLPGYVPHLVDKGGTRIVPGDGTVDIDDVDVAYTTNPVSANAVILRAPSSIDGDKETGCVPGFAEGEGEIVYVMSDKTVEQTQRFRFYHIGDENWDGKKVTLPTKSDIKKSKTGINDGYCVDYYVTSTKFTSKTSSNRIETIKELTTTVHSTAKTFYYTVESVKNAATTKETEDGQTVNINSSTQKLRLGGGENNRLYKVLYEKDSEDGKPKKYTIKDTSDVGKWFVIKAQAVELDVVNSSKLNVPNAVDFTNFTGVEGDSGSQGKIALSKVDTSNFESTGEEFKSLVLYDVESDFEKEFSADWDDEPSYKRESLTSTSSVSYSSSDENTQSGFGNLCCVGTVNITHKYTLAESNVNADGSNSGVKDKSEKISHHTDTYTITRYLYGASANVVENQDETEQSNSSGVKYYYWVEEYASRTLVSRRVLAVENENNDSTLLEKLAAVCDKFEGASKSDIIRYLKYVPIVAATSALTELGLSSLCEKIDAAQNAYPESMKKGKVDPREVRVEFMRFFPAYITRPDYSPSLNDGVEERNYFWIGKSEDARCAENVGIPSTSSSSDCKKNVISSPVNIADCFYNFESDRQPNETTILSAYSSYKFKGFVNNWLILKDKMEEEVRAYLEEHLHEEMEIAKQKKIKEKEEAKKEAIYKQKVEAKIKQKIQAGEIDDFFSDYYDDSYLTDEEKAIIRSSIRREDYELTEEEKNACAVTVRDLDFDLDEEVRAQISALFERPEKIIWYAKWEYSYDRDVEVVDDSNTGTTTKKEKTEEILYIPIPSPAGTCFPYLVGDAVINEDQFDSAGNLTSTKKVKIVKGYSVDSKGNVNAELEEYQITKKDVGSWFCFGPCVDYESGLKNYGGVEKVIDNNTQVDGDVDVSVISDVDDNPYEETSGIKWIQAVNNWGDPYGIAIRGGTKVGDVYYKLGKLASGTSDFYQSTYSLSDLTPIITAIQHKKGQETYITEHKKDDEEEEVKYTYLEDLDVDSDKYWYWNGCEWVKGGTYFSDANGEQVIFYKADGNLNIAVSSTGEQCLDDADVVGGESTDPNTDPKCAIGSRWDKTLNRNINGKANDLNDLHCNDFSKAIFKGRVKAGRGGKQACGDILAVNLNAGKEFHKAVFVKEKPIWDRPAYAGEDYLDQKEYLKCFGMAYTAVTYNIGLNKQCFRLWYRDYDAKDDDSKYVSFAQNYTYFTEEECDRRKNINYMFDMNTGNDESSTVIDCVDSGSVPDLSAVVDDKLTGAILRKYKGREGLIAKAYLSILSRNKRYLYLFYKGVLLKTYDYNAYDEWKDLTKENYPELPGGLGTNAAENEIRNRAASAGLNDKVYKYRWIEAQRLQHDWTDITMSVHLVELENGELVDYNYSSCSGRYLNCVMGPKYCAVAVGHPLEKTDSYNKIIETDRFASLSFGGDFGKFDIYVGGSFNKTVCGYVSLNGAFLEVFVYSYPDNKVLRDSDYLVTEVYYLGGSRSFVLCGIFTKGYDSSRDRYTSGFDIRTYFDVVHSSMYDLEYRCYVIGDCGSNIPTSKSELELYQESKKCITANYYHIKYNVLTEEVAIDSIDFPESGCFSRNGGVKYTLGRTVYDDDTIYSPDATTINGHLLIAYNASHEPDIDYCIDYSVKKAEEDREHNDDTQFCLRFRRMWTGYGTNAPTWRSITANAFVMHNADVEIGRRGVVDAKVLIDGYTYIEHCNGRDGAPSGEAYHRQLVLYAFYPYDGRFSWEIVEGAEPSCFSGVGCNGLPHIIIPSVTNSRKFIKKAVSVFGSTFVCVGTSGDVYSSHGNLWIDNGWYVRGRGVTYDVVDDDGCVMQDFVFNVTEKGMGVIAGNYQSAVSKVEEWFSDLSNYFGFEHSDYRTYTSAEYDKLRFSSLENRKHLELSEAELFALLHYEEYLEYKYSSDYGRDLARFYGSFASYYGDYLYAYTHEALTNTTVWRPARKATSVFVDGRYSGVDVSLRTVKITINSGSYRIQSGLNPTGSLMQVTRSVYYTEVPYSDIIDSPENAAMIEEKKWTLASLRGRVWGSAAPVPCDKEGYKKYCVPANMSSTAVFLKDEGIDVSWESDGTYCYCEGDDEHYQNTCPNQGHNCSSLVTRDIGDGAIYTPGGDTSLYFVGLDGVELLGEVNQDVFSYGWDSGWIYDSLLCSKQYAQCGLYQSVLIGRRLDVKEGSTDCRCNGASMYFGDTSLPDECAYHYEMGGGMGCTYDVYDWYGVWYKGKMLAAEDIYAGGSFSSEHSPFFEHAFTVDCFAICCAKSRSRTDKFLNNYVVLRNGRAFYKTKLIFSLSDCPGFTGSVYEEVKHLSTVCCGDGVLFTYNKDAAHSYQCLFIEGEPAYPFYEESGGKKSPRWIENKHYSLHCCGYDYYWLDCGSFTDDVAYACGDSLEDMYVFCKAEYFKRSYNNAGGVGYELSYRKYINGYDLDKQDGKAYYASLDIDDETRDMIDRWFAKLVPSFSGVDTGDSSASGIDSSGSVFGKLQLGESASAAFLKRNTPLRILSDGSKTMIVRKTHTEGGAEGFPALFNVDEDGVDSVSLSYEEEINEDGSSKKISHYRMFEVPRKWTVCGKNVVFDDDYSYDGYKDAKHGDSFDDLLACIKMEQVRHVPWKHVKTMNRQCFSYYRKKLISADPRIKEICCFRYRNENVEEKNDLDKCDYNNSYVKDAYRYRPLYRAIGAYAIFGDNPFYDAWADEHVSDFEWEEKLGSSSIVYEYHYSETPTVQNVLGVKKVGSEHNAAGRVLCDVDDYYLKRGEFNADNLIPCDNENPSVYDSASSGSLYGPGKMFCNLKGITKEAQKNVCMIVWSRDVCQTSYMHDISSGDYYSKQWSDWHKNDDPFDELWDGTVDDSKIDDGKLVASLNIPSSVHSASGFVPKDYWIRRLRSDVIYINDYNAAGRWDRVSGDDPVDNWQGSSHADYMYEKYDPRDFYSGGFWTSAPAFYPTQDSYNDNLNPCGKSRLVVSGNNTLYVFDANGRKDYDLFNGKQRTYPKIDNIDSNGED